MSDFRAPMKNGLSVHAAGPGHSGLSKVSTGGEQMAKTSVTHPLQTSLNQESWSYDPRSKVIKTELAAVRKEWQGPAGSRLALETSLGSLGELSPADYLRPAMFRETNDTEWPHCL